MHPERLRELLPWRHPFLMIDDLVECVPNENITALKVIRGDDLMALAHAFGGPSFRSTMVLEGMNQSAALLFQLTYGKIELKRLPLLGYLKAEFFGSAAPGDEIAYSVHAVKMTSTRGLFEGRARVGGELIAQGVLGFAVAQLRPNR